MALDSNTLDLQALKNAAGQPIAETDACNVYRARWARKNLWCAGAIKVARRSEVDASLAEEHARLARLTAGSDEAVAPRPIALGTVDGRQALLMEWVEGQSLKKRLTQAALPAPCAPSYVAQALARWMRLTKRIHAGREVMTDLKRNAVLLAPGGLRVIDWNRLGPDLGRQAQQTDIKRVIQYTVELVCDRERSDWGDASRYILRLIDGPKKPPRGWDGTEALVLGRLLQHAVDTSGSSCTAAPLSEIASVAEHIEGQLRNWRCHSPRQRVLRRAEVEAAARDDVRTVTISLPAPNLGAGFQQPTPSSIETKYALAQRQLSEVAASVAKLQPSTKQLSSRSAVARARTVPVASDLQRNYQEMGAYSQVGKMRTAPSDEPANTEFDDDQTQVMRRVDPQMVVEHVGADEQPSQDERRVQSYFAAGATWREIAAAEVGRSPELASFVRRCQTEEHRFPHDVADLCGRLARSLQAPFAEILHRNLFLDRICARWGPTLAGYGLRALGAMRAGESDELRRIHHSLEAHFYKTLNPQFQALSLSLRTPAKAELWLNSVRTYLKSRETPLSIVNSDWIELADVAVSRVLNRIRPLVELSGICTVDPEPLLTAVLGSCGWSPDEAIARADPCFGSK